MGFFSNDNEVGKVNLTDLIQSYHSLFCMAIFLSEYIFLPTGINKLSNIGKYGLTFCWAFLLSYFLIT